MTVGFHRYFTHPARSGDGPAVARRSRARREHGGTARYPWPQGYRVGAVEWRPIRALVENELREIGVVAELNADGDLVHRNSVGQRLTDDLTNAVEVHRESDGERHHDRTASGSG
jgi:hypothetical protein